MHALHCDLSQAQANYWIHHVLPVLQHALADLGMAPAREAHEVAPSPRTWEGVPSLAVDGTERRRQRPTDVAKQKEHYSGKKKTHTDKHLLLVNAHTRNVGYLGPTIAGTMHDKKAADEAQIASPANATLDKDTGFQGYEPAGVLTQQPQKTPKARS
jgi:hypothetical protein